MLDRKTKLLLLLVALQSSLFAIAPMLSTKTGILFGIAFLTGTALFGLCYVITDLVNSNWGVSAARTSLAICVSIRMFLYLAVLPLLVSIPTKLAPPNYKVFIMGAWWVFLAGEISTFVSQYFLEIPVFSWLKKRIGFSRSFLAGGLLNTAIAAPIFSLVAFWGTPHLFIMMLNQSLFSLIVRVVALPIALLANQVLQSRVVKGNI